MLRRISLITAMAAALMLPVGATLLVAGAVTMSPSDAVAKSKGKGKSHARRGGGKKSYGKKSYGKKSYSKKYSRGKSYSRKYYSTKRYVPRYGRYWRGRYYAYGVGPCWRLGSYGYVWICL